MKQVLFSYSLLASSLLIGCMQNEDGQDLGKERHSEKAKVGKPIKSDPYKASYAGPKVKLEDPYLTGIPEIPFDQAQSLDTVGTTPVVGQAKTAVPGYFVGVIPWAVSSCPVADRVNIYMDDEDDENNSSHTSLSPIPGGLNDNNSSNTRMILCKLPGENFQRLKSINYMVFNFGNGGCANGGIHYQQIVDNENDGNNNGWAGCCGNNDPDWWSTGGAYDGYVRLSLCYYPMNPDQHESVKLPSFLYRDYGVFTEANQDNAYIKSWGVVRQDDEDPCCQDASNGSAQQRVGSGNGWYSGSEFPGILDSWDKITSSHTIWKYGKIK